MELVYNLGCKWDQGVNLNIRGKIYSDSYGIYGGFGYQLISIREASYMELRRILDSSEIQFGSERELKPKKKGIFDIFVRDVGSGIELGRIWNTHGVYESGKHLGWN